MTDWAPEMTVVDMDHDDSTALIQRLDRHIRSLRVRLQDDYRHPRFIATVPGQGYRFVPVFTNSGWAGEGDPRGSRPQLSVGRSAGVAGARVTNLLEIVDLRHWRHSGERRILRA